MKTNRIKTIFFSFENRYVHQIDTGFGSNFIQMCNESQNRRRESNKRDAKVNEIISQIEFSLCVCCVCVSFSVLCQRHESGTQNKNTRRTKKKSVQFHAKKNWPKIFFLQLNRTIFCVFRSIRPSPVRYIVFKHFHFFSFGLLDGRFTCAKIQTNLWILCWTNYGSALGRQCHTSTNTAECTIENDGTTVWPVGSFDLVCRLRRRRRHRHRRRRLQRAILYEVRSKCLPNIR